MAGSARIFASKMTRKERIREHEAAIVLDMYQDMASYVDRHGDEISGPDSDGCCLLAVFLAVKSRVKMPSGTSLALYGYELVIKTPMTSLFRFGMGCFRLEDRMVPIRYGAAAENSLVYFINNVLPGGLALWREKVAMVDKDLLKQARLRRLLENNADEIIKSAFGSLNISFRLRFGNDDVVLQLFRQGKFITSGRLRYESFTEDLQAFINRKLQHLWPSTSTPRN